MAGTRITPKWTKSPESLVALFAGAIDGLPGVVTKKMFGCSAAFVNGNMFASLFQSSMIVRLAEGERRNSGAKAFEPTPGRLMREYVVVPETVLQSSRALGEWLRDAHAYVSSLPPKSARKKQAIASARKR